MIALLGTLVLLGLIFYFVTYIPMIDPYPQIVRVVAIIIAVVLVLGFLGVHILPINIAT